MTSGRGRSEGEAGAGAVAVGDGDRGFMVGGRLGPGVANGDDPTVGETVVGSAGTGDALVGGGGTDGRLDGVAAWHAATTTTTRTSIGADRRRSFIRANNQGRCCTRPVPMRPKVKALTQLALDEVDVADLLDALQDLGQLGH